MSVSATALGSAPGGSATSCAFESWWPRGSVTTCSQLKQYGEPAMPVIVSAPLPEWIESPIWSFRRVASGCVSITSSCLGGRPAGLDRGGPALHRVARVGVNERGAA